MATKKAKREAAEAKRAQFLADEKARGLAALEAGREAQKARQQEEIAEIEATNRKHAKVLARFQCRKCGDYVAPEKKAYHPIYCLG